MPSSPSPDVLRGITNVGIAQREGRALLIGSAMPDELRRHRIDPRSVEWVLLTHHHRYACRGAGELAALGARVAVPEAERDLFEHADRYWADDAHRNHVYNFHPSRRTLRDSVPVVRGLRDGDRIDWRGISVTALSTPGPTSGGLTYLLEADGASHAFVGELCTGNAKLRDYHLLQGKRSFAGGELMEYHGFGERAHDCVASLERILSHKPDRLVPVHGSIITKPAQAVAMLRARVQAARLNYHSISAGRWYFANVWPDVPDITADLRRRCRPLPPWVVEIGGTSRCIAADNGSALLIDCAGDAPERIAALQAGGRMGKVEALWITHYHDDHVDRVNAFRSRQACDLIAHHTMADILRHPAAFWMPCLDPDPIEPDRITRDGESWIWRDFRLTAFDLPGQTIYDAGLLVERRSERVLFVGDTFTPGGLDDYCTLNRNLLGPGLGHDRCLALLDRLGPDVLLVNEHVGGAFVFSRAEIAHMRRTLDERRRLFLDLLDWDDPNFGLDPQWVRLDPYHQRTPPGATVRWDAWIRNHAPTAHRFRLDLELPPGWRIDKGGAVLTVQAGREVRAELSAVAPIGAPHRDVVGLSVRVDRRSLGDITEAIVDVA